MKDNVILIKNLTKKFEHSEQETLSNINLNIKEGEFHIFLGPSGCGKSTLLNIIAGLVSKSTGELTDKGEPIIKPDRDRGVVFQNAEEAIFPWLTVEENIAYGLKMNKVNKADIVKQVKYYLELVGLAGHEKKYPHELSAG